MGKGKLAKFAQMEYYSNVLQYPGGVSQPLPWETIFANDRPLTLELACGKGEYTLALALSDSQRNVVGVDIKGARIWTGATYAIENNIPNAAFLRAHIEMITQFFAADSVEEIWLPFPDPQLKKPRKRLTATTFLHRYRQILRDNGIIHLKTDSQELYDYTLAVIARNHLPLVYATADLWCTPPAEETLRQLLMVKTFYEQMWMRQGLTIKYLAFRLPHGATPLAEPDD